MKSIFALLMLVMMSCAEQNDIKPVQTLVGKWTKYEFPLNDGRKIFKVIEFTDQGIVKIAYRIEKVTLYDYIGEFRYLKEYPQIWLLNPDYTVAMGKIVGYQLEIGGEIFNKEP